VVDQFDGLTSLREAIAYANSHPGPDTITFDPSVFGKTRRTIVLTGGPLVLTDPATTTIIGPGAKRLTISGGGKSGIFDIEGGSLALSGITIADGNADLGGGLRNAGGRLVLTNVVIQGNRAIVGGGLFNDGRTTLSAVSIKGNRAHVGAHRADPRRIQRRRFPWYYDFVFRF
jgi:fibronectin-binding autotransporter adhesin